MRSALQLAFLQLALSEKISESAALIGWASLGQVDRLQPLLDAGADCRHADSAGITGLHMASRQGHLAMVKALLACGAEAGVASTSGLTPLHWAALYGHSQVAMALLEDWEKFFLKLDWFKHVQTSEGPP